MGRPEIFKIFIACADCNIECSICWISWPSVDFFRSDTLGYLHVVLFDLARERRTHKCLVR